MIRIPLWLLIVLLAAILALALTTWSALHGRKAKLVLRDLGSLPDALPSIAGATHGTLVRGVGVRVLENGDGFFPVLLEDLRAARETISFETFVWGDGPITVAVGEALAERARAGVGVRLLVDSIGANRFDRDLRRRMEEAGCRVVRFRPISLRRLAWINARTHRKLVVVDGKIGYTFGHGISWEWEGNAHDARHWRDTAVRLEGPVVSALQSCFSENWLEATGEALAGARFFPPLSPAGPAAAHVAYQFQHGSASSAEVLYRLAIAVARERLTIQNPYFVPDKDFVAAMTLAVERGVEVRIMVPGEVTDSQVVRHASHRLYARLLEGGVRIFEYRKTLCHQKIIVVDRLWSHIGSPNFDNRSLESQDEVSVGIVDAEVAAALEASFDRDLAFSREVKVDEWRRRKLWEKAVDLSAYLFNEVL